MANTTFLVNAAFTTGSYFWNEDEYKYNVDAFKTVVRAYDKVATETEEIKVFSGEYVDDEQYDITNRAGLTLNVSDLIFYADGEKEELDPTYGATTVKFTGEFTNNGIVNVTRNNAAVTFENTDTFTNNSTVSVAGGAKFIGKSVINSGENVKFAVRNSEFTATTVNNTANFISNNSKIVGAFSGLGNITFANSFKTGTAITGDNVFTNTYAATLEDGAKIEGSVLNANYNLTLNGTSSIKFGSATIASGKYIIVNRPSTEDPIPSVTIDIPTINSGSISVKAGGLVNSTVGGSVYFAKDTTLTGRNDITAIYVQGASAADYNLTVGSAAVGDTLIAGRITLGSTADKVGTLIIKNTVADVNNLTVNTGSTATLTGEVSLNGGATVVPESDPEEIVYSNTNLTGTVTLKNATLTNTYVNGGTLQTAGIVSGAQTTATFNGENTISDLKSGQGIIIISGTLKANDVVIDDGGTFKLVGTLNAKNFSASSTGTTLNFEKVTALNVDDTISGKGFTMYDGSLSVGTLSAAVTLSSKKEISLSVDQLNSNLTIQATGGDPAIVKDGKVTAAAEGKTVTSKKKVNFTGTSDYEAAIINKGTLTVSGSLTAKSIEANAVVNPSAETLTYGTFTVANGTQLTVKDAFIGEIKFATTSAALGKSSFGAGSSITVNASNFIADEAALTLVAGNDPVLTIGDTYGLMKGAITINGAYEGEAEGTRHLVVSGSVGSDVTITNNVKDYSTFVSDQGVYLVKGSLSPATDIVVDAAWSDTPVDTTVKVGGKTYIIGYNAFASFVPGIKAAQHRNGATVTLRSNSTEPAPIDADFFYGATAADRYTDNITITGVDKTATISFAGGNDLCLTPAAGKEIIIDKKTTIKVVGAAGQKGGLVWLDYYTNAGTITVNGHIIEERTGDGVGQIWLSGPVVVNATGTLETDGQVCFRSGYNGLTATITIDGSKEESTTSEFDLDNPQITAGTTLEFTSGKVVTTDTVIKGSKFQISDNHWHSDCGLTVDSTTTTWDIHGNMTSGVSGFKDEITLKSDSLLNVGGTYVEEEYIPGTANVGGLVKLDLQDSDMVVTGAMTNSGKITLGTAPQEEEEEETGEELSNLQDAIVEPTSNLIAEGGLTNKATIEAKDGSLVSVTGTLTNSGKILVLAVPMRATLTENSYRTVTVTLKKGTTEVASTNAVVYDHQFKGWAPEDIAHMTEVGGDTVFAVFDFSDNAIADGEYDVVVNDPGFSGDVAMTPNGAWINTDSFSEGFKYVSTAEVANASISLDASTLNADSIVNAGKITVSNNSNILTGSITNTGTITLNSGAITVGTYDDENKFTAGNIDNTVVVDGAVLPKITIAGGTLEAGNIKNYEKVTGDDPKTYQGNIEITASSTLKVKSLTGIIDVNDGVTVTAENVGTTAKPAYITGGTFRINDGNSTTGVTLAGAGVSSAILNNGTFTIANTVSKVGNITNNKKVSTASGNAALTVGSITNNAGGEVDLSATTALTTSTITNKSSVTTGTGTDAVTKGLTLTGTNITTGAISNGVVKGSVAGTFVANGSVLAKGALTNNVGTATFSSGLEFGSNRDGVQYGITNTADLSVTGALKTGAITNGTKDNPATDTVETVEGKLTAGSLTASGALVNNAGSVIVNGDATFKKDTTLFDVTNFASGLTDVEDSVGLNVTGKLTAGAFDNEEGATAQVGSAELTSLTNASEFTATGAITASSDEVAIDNSGTITATNVTATTGEVSNEEGALIDVSGTITGATVCNAGTIKADTIKVTGVEDGSGLTNEGTIGAAAVDATDDDPAVPAVNVKIETTGLTNAGTIYATTLDAVSIANGSLEATDASITATGAITASGEAIVNNGAISAASVTATTGSIVNNGGTADEAYGIETGALSAVNITNGSDNVKASIKATSITASGNITNKGRIDVSGNVSVANGTLTATSGTAAKFNLSGSSELTIKKVSGTITVKDGAIVTANKYAAGDTAFTSGGTFVIDEGAKGVTFGGDGVASEVINKNSALTVTAGKLGKFTNNAGATAGFGKDVVVNVVDDEEIEVVNPVTTTTGQFTNNGNITFAAFADGKDVVVADNCLTVNGNFSNSGTITIDADGLVKSMKANTAVQVISVTGTLTNTKDINVYWTEDPENLIDIQVIINNDGDGKGVYLFKTSAADPVDMSELLVYSDLESMYQPGQTVPFGGHDYVYAMSAFANSSAITKIAEETSVIHFVDQVESFGNLNLNLFADQDLTIEVVNGTCQPLPKKTATFDSLNISSRKDDDGNVGTIQFNNAIVTGATPATVSIAAATAEFSKDANFSASKSVTITDAASVDFDGEFKAAAATISGGSDVDFFGTAEFSGNAAITGSTVVFYDDATFSNEDAEVVVNATITGSTVNFFGETTVEGTATISGSTVDFFDVATISGNATITGSDVEFYDAATFTGSSVSITGSTVDFDGVTTVAGEGQLRLSGSTVTSVTSITAGTTHMEKSSVLNITGTGESDLGTITTDTKTVNKIFTTFDTKLAYSTTSAAKLTTDIDVYGMKYDDVVDLEISGGKFTASDSFAGKEVTFAKYFTEGTGDDAGKLFKVNNASNVYAVTKEIGDGASLANARIHWWAWGSEQKSYSDYIVVESGTFSGVTVEGRKVTTFGQEALANSDGFSSNIIESGTFNAERTLGGKTLTSESAWTYAQTNGVYRLTVNDGEFNTLLIGGDRVAKNSGVHIGDINLKINGGEFTKNVAGGMLYDQKLTTGTAAIEGKINLTITGGTFEHTDPTKSTTIYGGNVASSSAYSANTVVYGDITVTIDAQDTISLQQLIVGSYGKGQVRGNTTLILSGDGSNLSADRFWGGCGSDVYEVTATTKTAVSTVEGERTLSFVGFKGELNVGSIKMFDTVTFDKDSDVNFENFKGTLAEIENWEIAYGSENTGAFNNSFIGDTLALTGLTDMAVDEETGIGTWTIFDDVSKFAADDQGNKLAFDSVSFDDDMASYELSIQSINEKDAMVLTKSWLA